MISTSVEPQEQKACQLIHDYSGCGQTAEGCGGACEQSKEPTTELVVSYNDQVYWQAFGQLAKELPWAPVSLLDLGCGNATQLSWLAGTNPWVKRVEAVESNSALYQQAITLHPCRVRYQQITDNQALPFEDNQFEMIVSHGYLNHVSNPEKAIDEMIRINDGIIVLGVLSPMAYQLVKWFPSLPLWLLNGRKIQPQQLSGFSLKQVKSQLQAKGYVIQSALNPWPYNIISAVKQKASV